MAMKKAKGELRDMCVARRLRGLRFLGATGIAAAAVSGGQAAWADSFSPASSRVTQVVSSQLYKQSAVIFKLDQGNSDCPAGSYIYYYSSGDDLKAMYATVLAAYLTNSPLVAHFPTTGSCTADNLGIGTF